VKDSFPLPRIGDLLDKLRNAKCMTHFDLCSAYNQVRLSDDGPQHDFITTTTFQGLTPHDASCLLEMLVMWFGLCNASANFSRLVNHVLEPYINNFAIVYLDDRCIHCDSLEQRIDHLCPLFRNFENTNCSSKCLNVYEVARRLNIRV